MEYPLTFLIIDVTFILLQLRYQGAFQIGGSFVYFLAWNIFFQSYPTKREKKFLLKNNDQIDRFLKLTFFNLTSMVQQIHLLQTIEGKEKTQLLVAISNFYFLFFMILKVFFHFGVFNILRLLWNLFCFFYGEEKFFFRSSYRSW